MKLHIKICSALLSMIARMFYRIEVYGVENIQGERGILAPNHVSFLDPPAITISMQKEVHFLAKKILFNNIFKATILKIFNTHPVDGSARDLDSLKCICKLLEKDNFVVIFPEGHRSAKGTLLKLQAGVAMIAQRSHVPIFPVYIRGTYDIWPVARKFPKLSGKITVTFGKAINPDSYSHLDKKEGQQAIIEALTQAFKELERSISG